MTLSTETDQWQELMGTDLCMKVLRYQDVDGEEEDAHHHRHHHHDEEQSVQLHDIVEIDWIGYYCNDAIKRQLGIPSTASPSDLVNNESPPMAGTTTTHANHNHIETDTTKTTSPSSSVLLSILNECPIFHSVQNLYCDVGDQDVIPAVEMGLRFLHVVVRKRRRREPNHSLPETVDETEDPGIITLPTVALIYSHSKYAYGISSRTYSTIIASDSASTNTTTPTIATTTTTTTGTHRNHNSYTLPSLSNVIYKVTLKRIVSSSTATVESPNILLQLFKCKKHLANDIYQNDILVTKKTRDGTTTTANVSHNHNNNNNNSYHCHRAVRIYQRTVERLENWMLELQNTTDDNGDDPVKQHDRMEASDNIAAITATASYIQAAQQLQIDCLNNISAVYLKCRLYHKAKEACIETLLKDANNSKALIRAAKAALYDPASSYEEVQAAFRAVQDIATMADDDDATLLKDLNALQKEYVHHQAKYKLEQKQMAVRIQEKLLTNRRRPKEQPQPRETSTDGTTNPASPASRTRSTITKQDDNTRETKPATTTNPRQHPTLHNNDKEKTVGTTWFGRHIQLFTNVPKTTTELLCSAILPILVLWILCLYGFMGYLLYTQQKQ